jgi:hypothetical protein
VGTVAGLLGAVALTRAMESLLFGVPPTDVASFAAALGVLVAMAALACWIPARRAAKIDPVVALRDRYPTATRAQLAGHGCSPPASLRLQPAQEKHPDVG